jgi:replication factor C small subunit
MIGNDILWVEIYRPKKVVDCIVPEVTKKIFQTYVDKGEIPNMMLTGTPGTGKTTIARAMCEEIGVDYILLNGSGRDRGVDTIKVKVPNFASSVSLGGGRKAIIMDEADGLTADAQDAFRGPIEEFGENCSFIFTCNHKNRIIPAIHSRCPPIDFKLQKSDKQKMAADFFKRALGILDEQNVPYKKEVVAAVITRFFPDFRRTLGELQKYAASGAIDEGILAQATDAKVEEIVGFLKAKDFKALRKWVGNNSDADSGVIMRDIYLKMNDMFKPESHPILVVLLGKYLQYASQVADQEINLAAFLTEVMVECEIK